MPYLALLTRAMRLSNAVCIRQFRTFVRLQELQVQPVCKFK